MRIVPAVEAELRREIRDARALAKPYGEREKAGRGACFGRV